MGWSWEDIETTPMRAADDLGTKQPASRSGWQILLKKRYHWSRKSRNNMTSFPE